MTDFAEKIISDCTFNEVSSDPNHVCVKKWTAPSVVDVIEDSRIIFPSREFILHVRAGGVYLPNRDETYFFKDATDYIMGNIIQEHWENYSFDLLTSTLMQFFNDCSAEQKKCYAEVEISVHRGGVHTPETMGCFYT